jgi:monomeric sarcosine oxidase
MTKVIVLGVGGMGSAAAAHLAARGAEVVAVEQFVPGHDQGSSHGESRIIRQAYFEDPAYVPLLLRAYELWEDLERDDPGLFRPTGGLFLGRPDTDAVSGSLASAREHDLPHEVLDADEIRRRFPAFAPRDDEVGVYEERSGYVRPERTVLAHWRRARAAGADLWGGGQALAWEANDNGVRVVTPNGTIEGDRLVIAPGAWAPTMLADLRLPLTVTRQTVFWFRPSEPAAYALGTQPVFVWERPGLSPYGFPCLDADGGVKIGLHHRGPEVDPDLVDRFVTPEEAAEVADLVRPLLPTLPGELLRAIACLYTTTPDHDFVIGLHPDHANVAIACGFSGHGFKFVPVVGEVLADLALDGFTHHPIGLFDPTRFG